MTAINSYTTNFRFGLINFDVSLWHTYEWNNWRTLDAILGTYFPALNLKGVWMNSTAMVAGESWVDSTEGQVYLCNVSHTSAATGTFQDERTANPTYWEGKSVPATARGVWSTGAVYSVGDFVSHGYVYAMCVITHTSTTWEADAVNWSYLIDGTSIVTDATTQANAASTSATNAYNYMIAAQTAAATITWSTLPGKPTFATVATSGSYNDLLDKPTLGTVASLAVDTDGTLTADSDTKVASQKATKTYVDTIAATKITVLRSYLVGLMLSTAGSTSSFTVSAGIAADSTNTALMNLPSAITKTTAAWSVGTGNGALDTGTAATGWYAAFLIKRIDTGVVDVLLTHVTAGTAPSPTLPTHYTLARRLGIMLLDSSGYWRKFSQDGDEFLWDEPIQDANGLTVTTTAQLLSLSIPPGIIAYPIITGGVFASAGFYYLISSPYVADTALTVNGIMTGECGSGAVASFQYSVRTNLSAQIRLRGYSSGALYITTVGWVDHRGRDE